MPDENASDSWLSGKIKMITGVVVALTALVVALVQFRDSIPWLTPVSKIDVATADLSLSPGDRIQLAATVKDKQGNTLAKRIKWSSANTSVVTVTSDGIVVAADATGETTVAAAVGPVRSVVTVHVRHVSVAKVQIFPDSKTIQVGEQLAFDATPYDDQQNFLAGRTVRWSSENNGIAEINPINQTPTQALGKNPGTVKITAASEEQTATALVTVAPPPAPPPPPPVGGAKLSQHGHEPVAVLSGHEAKGGHNLAADLPAASVVEAALATEAKISIVGGTKAGECPANLRILLGRSLVDLKSDPQEVIGAPAGDQTYNAHGTISCPGQTMFVADGHGSVTIAAGKMYRCVWSRRGLKNFAVTLSPQ